MIRDFELSKDWEKWPRIKHDPDLLKNNQPERLTPEDHSVDVNEMVCDSPNSENK